MKRESDRCAAMTRSACLRHQRLCHIVGRLSRSVRLRRAAPRHDVAGNLFDDQDGRRRKGAAPPRRNPMQLLVTHSATSEVSGTTWKRLKRQAAHSEADGGRPVLLHRAADGGNRNLPSPAVDKQQTRCNVNEDVGARFIAVNIRRLRRLVSHTKDHIKTRLKKRAVPACNRWLYRPSYLEVQLPSQLRGVFNTSGRKLTCP